MTSESEAEPEGSTRRIRFSSQREIRSLPESEAEDAQRARLPYSETPCLPRFNCSIRFKYAVFFFAPMWLTCSFTYQASLLFTSVSSLNLISSSSSLFVLVLSACIPSKKSKFTIIKALLVLMNLAGVLIVSQFSSNLTGAILAQISAISYSIYLVMYARFLDKHGEIDMNLMFGSVGLLGIFVGSPLILILDAAGIEALHPLPNSMQLASIVVSALFGTLLADYLWLLAAGMTDSLSASLSLTLSIPLSFLADSLLRSSPPSAAQLIAAIPISLSFVGSALVDNHSTSTRTVVSSGEQDQESLLTDEADDSSGA